MVQMHANAISKLFGFVSLPAKICTLKLMDYLLVQTLKPYNYYSM